MLKTLVVSLSMLALSSAASADPVTPAQSNDHDCFLSTRFLSYSYVDPHHVRIHAGPSRDYMLTTNWDARELRWVERIALRSSPSNWVCTGNGIGVEIIGGRPVEIYPVSTITRETPPPAPKRS